MNDYYQPIGTLTVAVPKAALIAGTQTATVAWSAWPSEAAHMQASQAQVRACARVLVAVTCIACC